MSRARLWAASAALALLALAPAAAAQPLALRPAERQALRQDAGLTRLWLRELQVQPQLTARATAARAADLQERCGAALQAGLHSGYAFWELSQAYQLSQQSAAWQALRPASVRWLARLESAAAHRPPAARYDRPALRLRQIARASRQAWDVLRLEPESFCQLVAEWQQAHWQPAAQPAALQRLLDLQELVAARADGQLSARDRRTLSALLRAAGARPSAAHVLLWLDWQERIHRAWQDQQARDPFLPAPRF